MDAEPLSPVTFGADDYFPLFTPDGKRLVYTSGRGGKYNLFWTASDGSGAPERLTDSDHWQKPTSWSRDGRVLLMNDLPVSEDGKRMKGDVMQVNFAEGQRSMTAVAQGAARELEGKFSPDGRFIAYASDESGEWEIYVRGYPDGVKRQVSVGGGRAPEWNPAGGELFYANSNALLALPIVDGRPAGPVRKLFGNARGVTSHGYAVRRDGQRFLLVEGVETASAPQQLNVVSNWVRVAEGRTRTEQR